MELSPRQLLAACGALFAGVVALNFASQYRSNEQFRTRLGGLDLTNVRSKLLREEGITEDVPEVETPSEWPAIVSEPSEDA